MKKTQSCCYSENTMNLKSNKRHGDWVCFLCNNLNYSFRDTCNRCKNMSRQQNEEATKNQIKQRNPLGELSLNRHSSFKQQTHYQKNQEYFFSHEMNKKYKIIEPVLHEFEIIQQPNINIRVLTQSEGFSSLLYLTPTRYIKLNEQQNQQQIQQKDNKSPCRINVVSPLIRALKDEINSIA